VVNYGMAIALDLLHVFTDEEIEELCRRNPEYEFERMPEGELLVSPPMGWTCSNREVILVAAVHSWNKRAGGGGLALGPSAGFTLPDRALFAPDAAWLDAERYAQLRIAQPLDKFAPVCPTFVFELVSAGDRPIIVRRKIESYIRNGANRAILIDPEERLVEVSQPGALHRPLGDTRLLTIPLEVLPGASEPFELDLEEIYAAGN
jgi:Uma2 family endonuclease